VSGTVDDEVVRMRFDNNAFERGVSTTLSTLSKLRNSLNFSGADKGLDKIEAKANQTTLQGLSNSVEGISKKFLALTTVALTALSNITNRAVNAGLSFAKSFTIQPVLDGLHEYQTNLQSIQTIQANTDQPLTKINASLDELNHYSDLTIYNFSEMARNIGTFTAAGVDLKTATSSIKGIANMAALSGSTSEQASTAMYQLSQAISSGRVGLQDWNSVVNAGMGGKKLQTALAQTAQAMGTLNKDAVTTSGSMKSLKIDGKSFRESITSKPGDKPWLSSEVLVNTLATLDGRFSETALRAELTATGVRKYTDEQIKAKIATARTALEQKNGVKYTDAQFKSLQKLSDSSFLAATQVKTLGQVFDVAKETMGSGWSATFKNIFGTFGEAKKTFTELSGTINGVINANSLARNTLLKSWHDMGGRTALIEGLKNAFGALGSVLKPIKEAFRQVFPAKTAQDLYNMTVRFRDFMESLKIGPETADKLKRVFAGVFALFDIGKKIVMGIFHVFGQLFGTITKGSGGFLEFVARIGDFVVGIDKALSKTDLFASIFQALGNFLKIPLHILGLVGAAIGQLFAGFHAKSASDMTNSLGGVATVVGKINNVLLTVGDKIQGLQGKIKPAVDWIVNAFKKIGGAISKGLGSASFANILSGIQTGLLAGIVVLLKKFFSNGLHLDIGNGFFGQASELMGGLTDKMKAMQNELKAKTLMEIAIAVGILSASIVALSLVDPKKVGPALQAMGAVFIELLAAMGVLTKLTASAGFVKIPFIAASLDLLAGAILLLSIAVIAMSRLSWEELKKGLTGVGLLLAAISAATYPLSANSAGMIRAGLGITAIAVALNLLAVAVKLFSMMKWGEMLKGLAGIGIGLGGIVLAMQLMPSKMLISRSLAILAISVALNALYLAVHSFSSMSWSEMVKGMTGVGIALALVVGALRLMPPDLEIRSLGLLALATALVIMSKAVSSMAKMSWGSMIKGLVGLAGAMGILVLGMMGMEGALPGAAALLVVATALRIFVPALQALGKMSWGQMLKGLVALAASFAVIGVAGLLLTPIIPSLIGLGVALGLVGLAMVAFGAGAALLGIGLTAIAASGGAAIGVLLGGLKSLIAMLPQMATSLATALVNFITIIGKHAPQIVGAFVSILNQLLQAVPKIMPNLVTALNSLIQGFLQVLTDNAPRIIAAGFKLLMNLLRGIKDNIGQITITVVQIITRFLNTLASHIGQIVQAGVNLLFKFLEGVARAAGQIPGEVVKIVGIFLQSLFGHFGEIVSAGVRLLGKLLSGIGSRLGDIGQMAINVVVKFINGLGSRLSDLATMGKQFLSWLLSGIWDGIKAAASWVWDKAKELGRAIINGIKDGIGSLASSLADTAKDVISGALGGIGDFLGIGGPSMLFSKEIGEHIPEGIAYGIEKNAGVIQKSLNNAHKMSLSGIGKTFSALSNAIQNSNLDFNPRITPVLDLSLVQRDAATLNSMVSSPVSAAVSYSHAADISESQRAAYEAAATTPAAEPVVASVNLTQINNSPKALSDVEIYRQTNNQMSQLKKLVGVPVKTP
jgi:tape measure domain-containing protein